MIAVIFREITIYRVKMKGGSDEQAQREAVTETAAALGFISAIGAVGGFFHSAGVWHVAQYDRLRRSARLKVFLIFYIVCVLLTFAGFMVGGSSAKNKKSMPDTSYRATTQCRIRQRHQIPIHSPEQELCHE